MCKYSSIIYLVFHGLYRGTVLDAVVSMGDEGREIQDIIECPGIHQKIRKYTGMSADTINKAMKTLEKLKLIRRVKKV